MAANSQTNSTGPLDDRAHAGILGQTASGDCIPGIEILAQVSHEMRTPLNAVLGCATLLLEGSDPLTKEQRQLLELLNSSGETMLGFLNRILDFAKIQAGKMDRNYDPFSPVESIHMAMDMVALKAQAKGLRLLFKNTSEIPPVLMGDEVNFQQILINLLSNAVKFTNQGHVSITASGFDRQDAAGYVLCIQIRDTGIGMSPEEQSRVFQPFSQASDKIRSTFGGSGLGLAITAGITKALGGTLHLESEKGRGTLITVHLPFGLVHPSTSTISSVKPLPSDFAPPRTANSRPNAPKKDSAPEVSMPGKNLQWDKRFAQEHPLNILVVDDAAANKMVAVSMLRLLGYQPEEADDGMDAIKKIAERKIDAILLDLRMPQISGLEVAHRVRAQSLRACHFPDRPLQIIAMTADPTYQASITGAEGDFDDFLSKPMRLENLVAALTKTHERLTSQPTNSALS